MRYWSLALAGAIFAAFLGQASAAYYGPTPFPVIAGGTGAATFTAHGIMLGEGTSTLIATAVGTNGQLLIGQSAADPAWETMAGDATMAANGTFTLATVNSNVGTFSNSTITVNGKGLITAASSGSASGQLPSVATATGATPINLGTTNLLTTIVSMASPTASTINLPSAVQANGFRECVKDGTTNFASNNATVKSPTAGTIDGVAGSTGVTLTQTKQEICFISDTQNWFIE
jgi:hypothetical protein